ncbi:TPA: hypothetical protein ACUT5J_002386 [Pseudomonas aeruginosa]|uniref:hypothetical protein n=1 Tax=Pseudomonas aeruginosa TaxID=287 RepID=UPI000578A9A8|nr:hypothetical protein [Pseudomonas aeruginosa]KPE44025.1 hypothetical protein AOA76_25520 [Pseudomonas aeruginosa]MEB5296627.1 hypothetical protein [Pseudomonas aeruginosa]MEB5365460.1 hypothetical protein [Pseudomonas aeruginosa]MEB5372066.1 hypothetical protein [Pseudomonas aeruginosa]MEB5417127.1 hypothetical protein [Pseudomonas aeruginosa]
MHHLTTLNLPTPSSKEADRQWLAARLAEAGLGQAPETSPIEPRPLASGQWTGESMILSQPGSKPSSNRGRPLARDDYQLIERASAMAKLGLSRFATARALAIGCARLDRLARENGITFTQFKAFA